MWSVIATRLAGRRSSLHRAGGVGEDERRHPERRDDAERNPHRRRVAGLVVMRPALEQEHALALELPGDETARMAGDPVSGKCGISA